MIDSSAGYDHGERAAARFFLGGHSPSERGDVLSSYETAVRLNEWRGCGGRVARSCAAHETVIRYGLDNAMTSGDFEAGLYWRDAALSRLVSESDLALINEIRRVVPLEDEQGRETGGRYAPEVILSACIKAYFHHCFPSHPLVSDYADCLSARSGLGDSAADAITPPHTTHENKEVPDTLP